MPQQTLAHDNGTTGEGKINTMFTEIYAVLSSFATFMASLVNVTNDAQVKRSEMGVANGVETLNTNSKLVHMPTKTDVGLGNVDNTSDASKNVLSASKLTTPRNINGVSFDGTSPITIPIPVTSVNGQTGDIVLTGSGGTMPTKTDVGLANVTNDAQVKRSEMGAASGVETLDVNSKLVHMPTKSDVGLSAVTNDAQVKASEKGAASGVATLDSDSKLVQMPTKADVGLSSVDNTADNSKNVLSATKLTSPRAINGVNFDGTAPITIPIPVTSVNGLTGDVTVGGSDPINAFDLYDDFFTFRDDMTMANGSLNDKFARYADNQVYFVISKIAADSVAWVGSKRPSGVILWKAQGTALVMFTTGVTQDMTNNSVFPSAAGVDFTVIMAPIIGIPVLREPSFWFGINNNGGSIPNKGGDTLYAVMFRRLANANWFAVTRNNGTETSVDTGIPATDSKFIKLHFIVAVDNSNVKFYIDDVLVTTITTNIPPTTVYFSGFLTAQYNYTSSQNWIMYLDFWRVKKDGLGR